MFTIPITTPEAVGIPSGCILNFLTRLDQYGIPMHSVLLCRHGKLAAEGYYAPYRANTLHRMFSISKSFTSIAIGFLADEGKLSLDDPIVTYFPDKVPSGVHPWIASMTIRDMLMMRTCHASTTYKVNMKEDWVESFFTVPPTHPAGKLFHYDTSSAHTLAALVERLSGMPMLDYLKEKLASLGFSKESYMLTDPFGVSMGGSGLVATPMDLLKFGCFISGEGYIDGKQLLSADYIRTAVSNLSDTRVTAPVRSEACGYGYQFWQNEKGGYVCYGMGGQFIIFLPQYDFICVTTADTQGIGGGNQVIYDALYEEILPFMASDALPEDKKAHTELLSMLKTLQIRPLEMELRPFHQENSISGKIFQLMENKMGFSRLSLSFAENTGTLHFTLNGTDCELSFGMGHLETGIFPVYSMRYAASGMWQNDMTLYLKFHIIDSFVGSVHFQFSFGKNDITVFLKKQEESLFTEFQGHLYGTLV